jgi:predicted esterase
LAELVASIFKGYTIDKSRMLIIGYSGGAEFTTLYYVPHYGQNYCGGGAILFGCGTPPRRQHSSFNDDFKKSFTFHFYAGQNDEYLDNAQKGEDYYRGLGFSVTSDYPSGINHTNIPFAKIIEEKLAEWWPKGS